MNTLSKESIRVRNKNKGKRKKNKKLYSRYSVEKSSYEHIGLISNNTNESFLSESSDTLNDDLIGLSKQRLKYPKNLTIGHLNINSVRNKFSSIRFSNHSLLLSKLKAYGFSNQALRLLQSYLCNRFQRSIINDSFSSWNEVITGVPQGSILGPLLFNIFLNDIFLFISKCQLCNYADDNTLYKSGKNIQKIKNDLEMDFMILHKWFHENHMVLNPDKCHDIVIGDDDPNQKIILNNNEIASSNEEKLLGILLDSKLNFDSHITSLCKKAGQKLSALARINHYLTQDQKLLLLNSVVKSQFSYCPLIWMFTSRYLNNALNSIHERALRLIYNDYKLPFDRILEDNKQKSIHQKNIESLAIEIYKFQAGLAPPIMSDLFVTRENNYNLRNFQELESSLRRTVKFGTETISYRGPRIWNLIPERIRSLETLNNFKKEIKSWRCDACPCRMCKMYIQRVGFIN